MADARIPAARRLARNPRSESECSGERNSKKRAQARRARLGRARQAGRHDLDPRGRGDQAVVHGQARRPCRHARSAGLRLPADRARRGDQDRAVRGGRPQDLRLHRALGRGARHRRCRRPRDGNERRAARRGGDPRRCCRASPARSSRCRRASPRSRSTASAPTISRARARPSRSRPAPVTDPPAGARRHPDAGSCRLAAECGKGTYVRALARDIGRALGRLRPCLRLAPKPGRPVRRARHDFAGTA